MRDYALFALLPDVLMEVDGVPRRHWGGPVCACAPAVRRVDIEGHPALLVHHAGAPGTLDGMETYVRGLVASIGWSTNPGHGLSGN